MELFDTDYVIVEMKSLEYSNKIIITHNGTKVRHCEQLVRCTELPKVMQTYLKENIKCYAK